MGCGGGGTAESRGNPGWSRVQARGNGDGAGITSWGLAASRDPPTPTQSTTPTSQTLKDMAALVLKESRPQVATTAPPGLSPFETWPRTHTQAAEVW